MRRLSISGLLGLVLALGVSVAALKSFDEVWAGWLLLFDAAIIGVAVLGCGYGRGDARAWWSGFAFFAGGYLVLAGVTPLAGEVRPGLGTTPLLEYVHGRLAAPYPSDPSSLTQLQAEMGTVAARMSPLLSRAARSREPALTELGQKYETLNAQIQAITRGGGPRPPTASAPVAAGGWRAFFRVSPSRDLFLLVGHLLLALPIGLAGGAIARRFLSRQGDGPPTPSRGETDANDGLRLADSAEGGEAKAARQLSVFGLMGVVLVLSVVLAAFRSANAAWVGCLIAFDLALVAVAVLGAVHTRGREQARWLGFALFGGCYLAATLVSPFPVPGRPVLGTTLLLLHVHDRLALPEAPEVPDSPTIQKLKSHRALIANRINRDMSQFKDSKDAAWLDLRRQMLELDVEIEAMREAVRAPIPFNFWRSLLGGRPDREPFVRVGHALFAILFGLAGAAIAHRFQARSPNLPERSRRIWT